MSIKSISVSAAISYLSEKWRKKTAPKTTKVETLKPDDFAVRQDKHLDFLNVNVGQASGEWRNDRF